ncbi:hypothetical protein BBK36DRAFT_1119462 [Trichoderma citrinoviride]|uniref:Uncharacterized protein n=1 Tax=Trichoderma citrinoviride TaxID=58853 RepID=A0A2T4BAM3_9HYPO|nr:hypothetical protein BBK36DRAFT_1119462 [Trichoderma citrinoviride]PTB66383.1 hypothetical protein BBK36DRAFT_1119462 [Trichoderma citrinoviride]
MSLFFCCGSRRRGRQCAGDAELPDTPEEQRMRRGIAIQLPRHSIEMPIRSRDMSLMPAELPLDDPTELGQLVVDDSDGEGEESNPLTKTSSALNVVRTKLIRHISPETEANRRSRASAGHSQEEVARRAELRRFRHQRIQEELKSEGNKAESSDTSHRSTRYLSPLIDAGQPRVGPRDAIEFTVTVTDGTQPDSAQAQDPLSIKSGQEDEGVSSQVLDGLTKSPFTSTVSGSKDGDQTYPLRPPSTHSATSQKLAGCSYNVPRLGRVLGADSEFDIRHGAYSWEEQSALGVWLAAQGLRSGSSSIRPGDSETNDGDVIIPLFSPREDFGGIDSVADAPLPIRCPNKTKGKAQGRERCLEAASFVSSSSNGRDESEADATFLGRHMLVGPGTLDMAAVRPADHSSSNYPSVLPSFQPSPDRSQANFHHLSAEDLESLELSPFSWKGDFSVIKDSKASEGMSSYVTATDNYFPDNNASSAQINCPRVHDSDDGASLDCSDSATFNQREVKSSTVGMRFGEALSRKKPSLNFGSRFKEDFHTGSVGPSRRSFMAKINLSIPRRSKYSSTSFGTAPSRRFPSERSGPLALECEDSIGMRLEASIGTSSAFRGEEGSFLPSDLNPVTLARVYDYQKPLGTRHFGALESSRLTPHSELMLDETQSSTRGILQQWTTNIHGAFSPNASLKSQFSKAPRRLTKLAPDSGEASVANTDLHQLPVDADTRLPVDADTRLPVDADTRSVPTIVVTEPVSRFRPGKLGKAIKSGLRKLMPSHGNERQAQLFQLWERQDENVGPKIVRTDTLSIACEPRDSATKGAAEYGTVSPKQHLSVEGATCCPPSAMNTEGVLELARPANAAKSGMQVELDKPAQEPCPDHCAEGVLTSDLFSQPHDQPRIEIETDEELERAESISVISDVRVLRRWKSALDVPMSRNLALTWVGQSMAQSLSLGNLRA